MTKLTTEELKDLLGKVTQGEWREGGHYGAVVSDLPSGYDDNENVSIYGGYMICESVLDHNMPLILQARELAAEVVELREAMNEIALTTHETHTFDVVAKAGRGEDFPRYARQALSQK